MRGALCQGPPSSTRQDTALTQRMALNARSLAGYDNRTLVKLIWLTSA